MSSIVNQVKRDLLKKVKFIDPYCSDPVILETRPKVKRQIPHIDFSEKCIDKIKYFAYIESKTESE